ncbi:hypothetical protein VP01_4055g4 [Puccinia sorghi]|uniref:Uncharacterized protein n=1 Tax=Puccinia sorghi TaxID=27349 RepID=A0A0L6URP1_9BASI|nr:hypothetical protein VP01_4055g4 [Puccinia sorghi]
MNLSSRFIIVLIVRRGIKAVLLIDQVEEEIELLTQELDRTITWVCQYFDLMLYNLDKLAAASREPIYLNNQFFNILPSFPIKGKARLISSEIDILLIEHNHLMLAWMLDVDLIWNQTRSAHTRPNHTWFDVIKGVKENLLHREIGEIDDALE